MTQATFIDPATDPRSAYEALLHGLHAMSARCPWIIKDSGGASPEILPNPGAVARGSGFLGFTAQQDHGALPEQAWQIKAGDILIVDPKAEYGPGDTLLLAAVSDEFTLAGIRDDGVTVYLRYLEEFDTHGYLVIGTVVEFRRISDAGRRVLARQDGGQ